MHILKQTNLRIFLISFFLNITFLTSITEAEEKFKVGLILPLSGTAADYGIAIKNSIELARQDKAEIFTNIKFLYEDAGNNTNLAVTSFNKLLDFEKVDIIATFGVPFCQALAPLAENRKIPLIGFCIDPKSAANRNYVMRYMNVTDEFMKLTAEHLNQKGFRKLAIITSDNSYLEEMLDALKRNLSEDQTLTIVDRSAVTEMDFRSQIMKIKKSGYDALGVFVFLGQLSTFYKQAKQMNLNIPTFGTNLFETSSEIKTSQGTMENALFSSIKINNEYIKKYKSIFNQDSQLSFGAPAYEFTTSIGELFNNSPKNSLTGEKIINAISQIKNKKGTASGPYFGVIDKEIGKYMVFPITMKQIRGNEFEILR